MFSLLPWVLDQEQAAEVWYSGAAAMADRYEQLGLTGLLPTDRVWVGVRSARPGAFGGFHHRDQGYRHLQMGAVITRYGPLAGTPAAPSELAVLDLLRAYAHDCLHYGSYRRYRLHAGEVFRTHYGINVRTPDGATYSARDAAETTSTRNLGVVMEGATDREARAITRHTAHQAGITEPGAGPDLYAYLDVTGQLTATDTANLVAAGDQVDGYLRRMGSYQRGVNAAYATFLAEIGGGEAEDMHRLIVKAMITGSLTALRSWLDNRHGPDAFATLFKSRSYTGPEPGSEPARTI